MKTRNGFVSNSSTSSFLIYGTFIENNNRQKLINTCQKFLNEPETSEDDEVDICGLVEEAVSKASLNLGFWSVSGEYYYIGRSWGSIKDDETGKQFKETTENTIKQLLGDDVKCTTHQEAWYS